MDLENLKAKWEDLPRKKKIFFGAAAAVALGVLVGSCQPATADVLIEDNGAYQSVIFTGSDIECEPASKYDSTWEILADSRGLVVALVGIPGENLDLGSVAIAFLSDNGRADDFDHGSYYAYQFSTDDVCLVGRTVKVGDPA